MMVEVLYRHRNFLDEWSLDDGNTWTAAKKQRRNFQYYIEGDFGSGDETIPLFFIDFRWWRESA